MVLSLAERLRCSPAGAERPLTRAEMVKQAKAVSLDTLDLGEYRRFCEEGYARNVVDVNDHFELVVICWQPGQKSAIHDHGKSNCLYLVVEGRMQEELYRVAAEGLVVPAAVRRWGRGDITVSAGKDIHCISNEGNQPLVTVHIYSPPLGETMGLYAEA